MNSHTICWLFCWIIVLWIESMDDKLTLNSSIHLIYSFSVAIHLFWQHLTKVTLCKLSRLCVMWWTYKISWYVCKTKALYGQSISAKFCHKCYQLPFRQLPFRHGFPDIYFIFGMLNRWCESQLLKERWWRFARWLYIDRIVD